MSKQSQGIQPSSFIIHHSSLTWILVLGGLLRLVPIWFGLPYGNARPDEETALGYAVAILGGNPNPHFFHWPSLTLYLFAGLFQAASSLRDIAGLEPHLTDVHRLLIGRAAVALAGTATIGVVFRIGRRVGGGTVGLIAAFFLAVSVLHVRESHFAMTDALMTFLAMTALALLLQGFDSFESPAASAGPGQVWAAFAPAGLAAGLAASTKYTAAAVLASLAAVHVLLLWRSPRRQSRIWLAAAAFAGFFVFGFLAGTPFAVLDADKFGEDLHFNFTHLSEGHGVNLGRGWIYHLTRSLPYGVSLPIFIAAIAGIVPFIRHHRSQACILGAFAIASYVSVGNGRTVFFRYVLPIVPIMCVSAAVAVDRIGRRSFSGVGRAGLALAVGLWGAVNCIWFDVLLAKTDSRVVAREWLDAHLTRDDTFYEAENTYASLDRREFVAHEWRYDAATGSFVDAGDRTPDWLVLHQSPLWTYATIPTPLRRLAAEKYELVATIPATRGAARSAVYDLQDAFFLPVSGFGTVIRPGPTVLIYRRK
jgi:hypothetical protein